jgi:HECT-domain (ubiquitin-transferase)
MQISTEVLFGCCIPLIFIVNCSENDIEDALDLTFSTEDDRFGEVVTVDLKPDGQNITVTNENKKEYVEYVSITSN